MFLVLIVLSITQKRSTHYDTPSSYIPHKLLDIAGFPITMRWALLMHSSPVVYGL
jgi:hypothetical protein